MDSDVLSMLLHLVCRTYYIVLIISVMTLVLVMGL